MCPFWKIDRQYGFKQKICTENSLIQLTNEIQKAIDNGREFFCLFLGRAFEILRQHLML